MYPKLLPYRSASLWRYSTQYRISDKAFPKIVVHHNSVAWKVTHPSTELFPSLSCIVKMSLYQLQLTYDIRSCDNERRSAHVNLASPDYFVWLQIVLNKIYLTACNSFFTHRTALHWPILTISIIDLAYHSVDLSSHHRFSDNIRISTDDIWHLKFIKLLWV